MSFVKKVCSFVLSVNLFSISVSSCAMSNYQNLLSNFNIGDASSVVDFSKKNIGFDDRPSKLPTAGERNLLNFLLIAIYAIGILYTWGGGWNAEDTGAGLSAKTIGLRQKELAFAREHFLNNAPNYEANEKEEKDGVKDYVKISPINESGESITLENGKEYMYKYIYNGKDCSGFVGWVVYNTLNDKSYENKGYVVSSTGMAKFLADEGLGTIIDVTKDQIENNTYKFCPGDIVSIKGHVYISLGQCEDGSILLVHSSYPGVCIMGTTTKDGNTNSEAIQLAKKCNEQYPIWNKWYNDNCKDNFTRPFERYTTNARIFRWNDKLSDDEGIKKMSPEKVLKHIFPNLSL